jgi:hypothetical protein
MASRMASFIESTIIMIMNYFADGDLVVSAAQRPCASAQANEPQHLIGVPAMSRLLSSHGTLLCRDRKTGALLHRKLTASFDDIDALEIDDVSRNAGPELRPLHA